MRFVKARYSVARISGKKNLKELITVQFALFVWTGKPSGVVQYDQDNCSVLKMYKCHVFKGYQGQFDPLSLT